MKKRERERFFVVVKTVYETITNILIFNLYLSKV